MSIAYVQSADGTSKTALVSENLHTFFYAYDGDTSSAATGATCDLGFTKEKDASDIHDAKHIFGFIWKNDSVGVDRVNGDKNYDKLTAPLTQAAFAAVGNTATVANPSAYESYGYPSSNHPSSANFSFCDGHIVSISDSIDPRIYGQIMTSNRNRSNLASGGIVDRKLPQPSDSDY
jgi:prepilin-type processing-associated H-X9-DG protein